ncbi:MAG: hypothetical protein IT478_00005, partial [Xanthomonadales bacterium]|nr:hypothetical protein [Xanthomonadales bacterium]
LHLRRDSPAIDYATSASALGWPYNIDTEGSPRPLDDSGITNQFGSIDVGAFESATDALFADGFDS